MIGTSSQHGQLALYSISLFFASVAVSGRLYARRITHTKWQWNDWLMIFAYVNVVGLVISAVIGVVKGEMGVHLTSLPKHRLEEIMPFNLKMTIVAPIFLYSASFLVKMSITHLYIVLFPHTPLQWICKVQLVLLTLAWLSSLLPTFFMCEPLEYTWNRKIEGGRCINIKAFWRGTGAIALFFDVTCVVLPLPVLWSLKMGVWQKLKLTMLFGLGLGICIITALRIYYDELMDFADLSYTAAPVIMCAVPEPSFAIVLGSIPIMLPLFTRASNTVKSGFANNKPTFTPSPGQSRPPTAQTQDLPHRPAPLQRSDSKKFKQWVDHVYPLTPITEGGRGSDESGRAGYSVDLERGSRRIPSWGRITIRKEVRVNSEKNHVHDAKLEAEKERKKRRRSSFKRGHLESDSVQERPEPCCPRGNEI